MELKQQDKNIELKYRNLLKIKERQIEQTQKKYDQIIQSCLSRIYEL